MTQRSIQSVLIIGAGPAGLTAADGLVRRGFRVMILDQAAAPGARLREPDLPALILGCHDATSKLIGSIGSDDDRRSWRDTGLEFALPDGRLIHYPRSRFPTPLHVVFTLGRFAGLPWRERWKLLSWLEAIWEGSSSLPSDLEHRTAREWLRSVGQNDSVQRSIWAPLARWLTGNDPNRLSADALISAVQPFLLRRAADSRIMISARSWQALFVTPLCDRLSRQGVTFLQSAAAVQLRHDGERVTGVRLTDGSVIEADWYVSALPPDRLSPILPERWLSRYAYFQQMTDLATVSCTIVHLRVRQPVTNPRLILLANGPFHWMQASRNTGIEGRYSMVTDGDGNDDLDVAGQSAALLQSLGIVRSPDQVTAVTSNTMPRAVLSLSPGTRARRPIQKSPIANLMVAGAWTDTGWPANLESAIVSGDRCAELIAAHAGTPH